MQTFCCRDATSQSLLFHELNNFPNELFLDPIHCQLIVEWVAKFMLILHHLLLFNIRQNRGVYGLVYVWINSILKLDLEELFMRREYFYQMREERSMNVDFEVIWFPSHKYRHLYIKFYRLLLEIESVNDAELDSTRNEFSFNLWFELNRELNAVQVPVHLTTNFSDNFRVLNAFWVCKRGIMFNF